ncbi:MAG: dockerin type I repeat-containing protein [Clostridia bacterium]|nr:dockerin type I repeat-containing protein [Clostridia bacterium]
MKKTNKLISILLAVAMILSLVPMNLSVSAVSDTDANTEPTYVASITDKDGNLIGNYETLKDAVKSAERTEDGTLTLLDNIIVTDFQYINSGKFTIDLNGKTLLHETTNTLWVEKAANLTIKDSGVGGTIQSDGETAVAILNKGTLTIESGIFKGDGGISTHGTLTFKDGEVVATGYYSAITNYGTAYVHNGTFESVDGTAIVNNNDATIYIYDGKFSGYNAFTNFSTAYIEDGEFKGNAFAALSINGGTVEVTGGSFTGTDDEDGFFSGTPYGEFTVYDDDIGSLILKGGEFPKGFSAFGVTANEVLADGYYFCDADGKKITVAEDATSIEGYVKVKEDVAASVTDKDGNLIGNYKTFADAVAVAQESENCTLTLLADVTVAGNPYIDYGKLTIDLNGKTLLHETDITLNIQPDADVTIKDSGEGGTIQTNGETAYTVFNYGTLTIESGFFKGDCGIANPGKLTFKNGEVEAGNYEAIRTDGTAYIENGKFESENGHGIVNGSGTAYIYGGNFSGKVGIMNFGTTYIEGGNFTGKSNAAIYLNDGTVEVTGGSFTGTDEKGYDTGTPYGEYTVYDDDTGSLILKGGEFPKGFSAFGVTANEVLADGYYFCDADGKKITVAEDATSIEGYVKVKEDVSASVTDKDGNLIGKYKTFEEAVTATKTNPNSTLKLLDNADGCYVRVNSPFTLDLNGYTLDMGDKNFDIGVVLEGYDCHLTVTDTSETETGKIISESYSGVFFVGYSESPGKLTVLNGTVEYNNEYGCAVKLENNGVLEIKGGTFINCESSEIIINNWIDNFEGSVDISGGTFPDGFDINVYSSDYTSTENCLTDLLAEDCYFYDADGKKITVAEDSTSIEGYVQVKEHYIASVTDKDGNLIGNYKTFEEAVESAERSEGSTLTLLDNITLTETATISSGTFTLDLNGKTLLNETATTLWIDSDADITIRDSGKDGTVQNSVEFAHTIFNLGTLTIESGCFKAMYSAINSYGTLKINGGTFEASEYAVYICEGYVEINNGIFKGPVWSFTDYTINGGTFDAYVGINKESGVLTVNDGTFNDNKIMIMRGTVNLKCGEFTNGIILDDVNNDEDDPRYLNDLLADGCFYRDANGEFIEVADDATAIDGYVKVVKGVNLLTEADITLSKTEFEFTGKEIIPEIKILIDGIGETDISDFLDIVYENNTNAGTATVTISGKEDSGFTGKVTRRFTIVPKKVEVIWLYNRIDGGALVVEAHYYDVNNIPVALDVENGVNAEPGVYTASVVIEDTNYVAENLNYKYIIDGDKSLSGTVTSFNSETDEVTLLLYKEGDRENAYKTTVTGNSADYAFEKIAEGEYILEVSKVNHATRFYEVTVGADEATQDAKIHLIGDINGDGKVMITDYNTVLRHVKKTEFLEGYALACADVSGDGRVMITDYNAILRHVKKISSLW